MAGFRRVLCVEFDVHKEDSELIELIENERYPVQVISEPDKDYDTVRVFKKYGQTQEECIKELLEICDKYYGKS